MVSANSATLPVKLTITDWTRAVASNAAREILVVQTPRLLANISPSTAIYSAMGVTVAYLASVSRLVVNVHPLSTGTLVQLRSPNLTPGRRSP